MDGMGRDVQASHVTFTKVSFSGDLLLQEIPSPRPRLCSKVDELSNATGTDTVDLGDMGTRFLTSQVVQDFFHQQCLNWLYHWDESYPVS